MTSALASPRGTGGAFPGVLRAVRRALAGLAVVAGVSGAAACGSETDARPVTWSYLHAAIILPNCATSGCHSSLTKTRGVDLEDKTTAYVVFQNAHFQYDDLGLLLEGRDPTFYRMPPDQPLPDADIDLIKRWLAAGAKDD